MEKEIEVQVVMLPQSKPIIFPCIGKPVYYKVDGNIPLEWNDKNEPKKLPYEYFHLYLTSNEDIKEGDFVLGSHGGGNNMKSIACASKDGFWTNGLWKKIVACSKKNGLSLPINGGLPVIPEEWIRTKYVPSNGKIDTIMLSAFSISKPPDFMTNEWVLETAANNEVVLVESKEQHITHSDVDEYPIMGTGGQQPIEDEDLEDAVTAYIKENNKYFALTPISKLIDDAFKAGWDAMVKQSTKSKR